MKYICCLKLPRYLTKAGAFNPAPSRREVSGRSRWERPGGRGQGTSHSRAVVFSRCPL